MDDILAILRENTCEDDLPRETQVKAIFDSLDWSDLCFDLEDKFDIRIHEGDWETLYASTIGDLLDYVERLRSTP